MAFHGFEPGQILNDRDGPTADGHGLKRHGHRALPPSSPQRAFFRRGSDCQGIYQKVFSPTSSTYMLLEASSALHPRLAMLTMIPFRD